MAADVPTPHPAWASWEACNALQNHCGRREWRFTLSDALGVDYGHWIGEGENREIVHWRFFTGAHPPDRTEVEVTWDNTTTVNVSRGGGEDMFWYFREDFDHETYVQVDGLSYRGPTHEEGATMETSLLGESDERAFFFYEPDEFSDWEDGWVVSYRRPDGSTWRDDSVGLESTNQTGTWRFAYPQSNETTKSDRPVLWGYRGAWTEMPWGVS